MNLDFLIEVNQPVQAFEKGRFSAAGWSNDRCDLAVRDIYRNILKHFVIPISNC
jgi:hypothetical protein